MTQAPFLLKAAVLGGAIVLGSGFVYVRAGGRLPGIPQEPLANEPKGASERTLMPGSKSRAVAPSSLPPADSQAANQSQSAAPKAIMYSSKSGAIVSSSTPGSGTPQSATPVAKPTKPAAGSMPAVQPAQRSVIMSSSKSIIISDPKDPPIINAPRNTAANITASPPVTSPSPLDALPPIPPAIYQQPSPLEVAPNPAPPQPSPLEALKKTSKRKANKSSPAPNSRATDPLPVQQPLQQRSAQR